MRRVRVRVARNMCASINSLYFAARSIYRSRLGFPLQGSTSSFETSYLLPGSFADKLAELRLREKSLLEGMRA